MSRRRPARRKLTQLHYPRFVRTEYLETLQRAPPPSEDELISESEIEHAFDILDPDGLGEITFENLQSVIGGLYPQLPSREYSFLLSGARSLRKRSLNSILQHESLPSYNPLREAFRVFDPHNTGYFDIPTLKRILTSLGFPGIGNEDVEVVLGVADVDKDGRISYNDFVRMLTALEQENAMGEDEGEEGDNPSGRRNTQI